MQRSQTIYDRPISEDSARVSQSAFALLFCEVCSRTRKVPVSADISEWQERLFSLGYQAGHRSFELCILRDQEKQRPTTCHEVLLLIADNLWMRWFGKSIKDQIFRSNEQDVETYLLDDPDHMLTKYIRVTSEFLAEDGQPTVAFASYTAGMMNSVLDDCGFNAKVTAFAVSTSEEPNKAMFRVEFEPFVLERERKRNRK